MAKTCYAAMLLILCECKHLIFVYPLWIFSLYDMNWVLFKTKLENCALLGYYSAGKTTGRMGPMGFPDTSLWNYHYSLRNSPEEIISLLLRDGSLKSHKKQICYEIWWKSSGSQDSPFVLLLNVDQKKTLSSEGAEAVAGVMKFRAVEERVWAGF